MPSRTTAAGWTAGASPATRPSAGHGAEDTAATRTRASVRGRPPCHRMTLSDGAQADQDPATTATAPANHPSGCPGPGLRRRCGARQRDGALGDHDGEVEGGLLHRLPRLRGAGPAPQPRTAATTSGTGRRGTAPSQGGLVQREGERLLAVLEVHLQQGTGAEGEAVSDHPRSWTVRRRASGSDAEEHDRGSAAGADQQPRPAEPRSAVQRSGTGHPSSSAVAGRRECIRTGDDAVLFHPFGATVAPSTPCARPRPGPVNQGVGSSATATLLRAPDAEEPDDTTALHTWDARGAVWRRHRDPGGSRRRRPSRPVGLAALTGTATPSRALEATADLEPAGRSSGASEDAQLQADHQGASRGSSGTGTGRGSAAREAESGGPTARRWRPRSGPLSRLERASAATLAGSRRARAARTSRPPAAAAAGSARTWTRFFSSLLVALGPEGRTPSRTQLDTVEAQPREPSQHRAVGA